MLTNSRTALLTIIAAVLAAAGFGWYLVDRQRPVDAAARDELASSLLSTSLELQEQLTVDIDRRQLAEETLRAESEDGLRLYALCDAWIEFDNNHPDESTRANRDRACGDYRRYIETGELPD
ncbi:MAG: hypothetical protein V2I25_16825 [Woeseiaceae bacterium]|jgi:hypothetical protein|nr:hypothetical protein [Woeseiaceae bacterium]